MELNILEKKQNLKGLERIRAELKVADYKFRERVKELNCLYGISQLVEKPEVSFEEIVRGTLELIPPAWQFPEVTCARITYDNKLYKTENFKETEWKLTTQIEVNEKLMEIEVYYLEDNPFLKEEINLINDIGKRLKIIIEHMEAEQKLKEIEEKFRKQNVFLNNVIESLPHPFLVINVRDYTIKLANSTAFSEGSDVELFCYSLAHNRNKPCEYPCVCPLTEVMKTKKSCTVEHVHYDKEGNARFYEIQAYPLLDDNGNVVQLIEYAIDITERKNAQQISKDTERKYKFLFEQVADAIILIDTETGDTVDFNNHMNENLGYTREEFKTLRIPDFNLMENTKEYKGHIENLIRNGSDIFETQYIRKNGEIRDILVNAKSIKMSGKYYLQSILRDITDIRKTERQSKESKEKFSYVNNISIILGLVLSAFYLFIEGLVDNYIFHDTEYLFQDIFTTDPHEILMHLIPISLILFAGIFSQYLINAQRKAEDKLKEAKRDLMERVKELTCLYGLSKLIENPKISQEAILRGTLDLILPAWQFPEITCARINFGDTEFKTSNFKETEWKLTTQVEVNEKPIEIEVYYLEDNPFLKEEINLINDIVKRLKIILEQMEAEQKLKESEQRYRELYEDAPNAYFTIKPDKSIKSCNQATVALLGYYKEEFQNMKFFDLYYNSPEGLQKAKRLFKQFLEGKNIQDIEIQMKHKNGNPIWVSLTVKPVRNQKGQVVESRSMVINITERKRAKELIIEENQKLTELNKIKNNLIVRSSFELKNPLTAICNASEILLSGYKNDLDERANKLLKIINKGGKKLNILFTKLTEISRIKSKNKLQIKYSNLTKIIHECINELSYIALEREQFLNVLIDEIVYLYMDSLKIKQVISEIILNALHNTPTKGMISINLQKYSDFINIVIKDTGVGFTAEEKLVIFREFGKIERYGKGMDIITDGIGMGLHFSKEIINLHGGKIWVESEGKSKGSVFIIQLPLTIEEK